MARRRTSLAVVVIVAALVVFGAVVAEGAAKTVRLPRYKVSKLGLGTAKLDYPADVVVSPNGKTLYVADAYADIVYKIPVARPARATKVPSPCDEPGALAVSPNAKTLYEACWKGGVEAIDLASGQAARIVVRNKSKFDTPDGLAVSPSGKLLYIANFANHDLQVADVSGRGARNDSVIGLVSDARGYVGAAGGLALSPTGKTLYISDWKHGRVSVANVGHVTLAHPGVGRVTRMIRDPDASTTAGVAVSPDGKTLYISNDSPPSSVDKHGTTVSVADIGGGPDNDKVVGKFGGSFQAPWGIAIDAAGNKLYLVNNAFDDKLKRTPDASLAQVRIPSALTRRPTISGHARVGNTLKAVARPATGAHLSYQWYANGRPIKRGTKRSLKLATGQVKKRISVSVTVTAIGYNEASLRSGATAKVNG